MSRVHPQARTTPRTRAEIRSCEAPLTVVAERYNVTKATVRKWRGREDMQDCSHRPNTLATTLTPAQEAIVVELRRTLLLPLDDLLALTHEFINRAASRSGLDRCLRRHGVSNLAELIPVVEGEPAPKKTFKDYADQTKKRYLFVAIDRATRWVYFRTYADQTEASSTDFLGRLQRGRTDGDPEGLDRQRQPVHRPIHQQDQGYSGKHLFDLACSKLGIEHRLAPPRHPQTNGMVERFNGHISELVAQTRFACAAELDTTLKHYLATYNHSIAQRALNHQSPVQALKSWQAKKPRLFVKRVYEHTGLDI